MKTQRDIDRMLETVLYCIECAPVVYFYVLKYTLCVDNITKVILNCTPYSCQIKCFILKCFFKVHCFNNLLACFKEVRVLC